MIECAVVLLLEEVAAKCANLPKGVRVVEGQQLCRQGLGTRKINLLKTVRNFVDPRWKESR